MGCDALFTTFCTKGTKLPDVAVAGSVESLFTAARESVVPCNWYRIHWTVMLVWRLGFVSIMRSKPPGVTQVPPIEQPGKVGRRHLRPRAVSISLSRRKIGRAHV